MKHKGNKNLTFTQRLQIEAMLNSKISRKEICSFLNIHKSTLSREIKKGTYLHKSTQDTFWKGVKVKYIPKYSANLSQIFHDEASKNRGCPIKLGKDYAFVEYMEKRVLEDKISACAVLGEIKRKNLPFVKISKPTLYRYIEKGYFSNIKIEKRKKTYRKQVAKRPPRGLSIEQRPKEIDDRITFGHWEMDSVVGPTKSTLLTMTERLTRFEIVFKMENQKASSVVHCLNILERKLGKNFKKIFKSITVDNGSEFADHIGMTKSIFGKFSKRTTFYYCHPYSSYERGTNERLNKEVRRLIPKGSNISKYSVSEIQKVQDWVNAYPREIFGYATSGELFEEQLKLLV